MNKIIVYFFRFRVPLSRDKAYRNSSVFPNKNNATTLGSKIQISPLTRKLKTVASLKIAHISDTINPKITVTVKAIKYLTKYGREDVLKAYL